MITGAFLTFLHGLASSVFGWLSGALPSPPTFWTDTSGALDTVLGLAPPAVLWFVPIAPVAAAGLALVSLLVVLGALRLARRVLSLFTGGGGMA